MTSTKAQQYLSENDPVMASLIKRYGSIDRSSGREDYFESLVRSVVSQQLSVSAARTIFGRLADKTNLQREKILQLTPEEMKVIGLSSQKQNYIKDLAVHFMENDYSDSTFDTMSDDDVITHLVKIKGIGEWTAQMFLMFTLRRPDVFAPGDRGLQVAINRLYGVGGDKPKPSELVEFAERWAPYRTTACMYLWESLENS